MNLSNVNTTTVLAISVVWEAPIGACKSIVSRELELCLLRLERDFRTNDSACFNLEIEEIPPANPLAHRGVIERSCDTGPSFPGRPSLMRAIVQELERRSKTGELAETLAEESRHLSRWASSNFPGSHTPTARSVENGIRSKYRTIKWRS